MIRVGQVVPVAFGAADTNTHAEVATTSDDVEKFVGKGSATRRRQFAGTRIAVENTDAVTAQVGAAGILRALANFIDGLQPAGERQIEGFSPRRDNPPLPRISPPLRGWGSV